ncbi:hypothetical protein ANO11243_019920 [Dothideomycetidae sp. 11243]|nr:hypothetical protein ANO11243_019920 [fungal sp. No.11243]
MDDSDFSWSPARAEMEEVPVTLRSLDADERSMPIGLAHKSAIVRFPSNQTGSLDHGDDLVQSKADTSTGKAHNSPERVSVTFTEISEVELYTPISSSPPAVQSIPLSPKRLNLPIASSAPASPSPIPEPLSEQGDLQLAESPKSTAVALSRRKQSQRQVKGLRTPRPKARKHWSDTLQSSRHETAADLRKTIIKLRRTDSELQSPEHNTREQARFLRLGREASALLSSSRPSFSIFLDEANETFLMDDMQPTPRSDGVEASPWCDGENEDPAREIPVSTDMSAGFKHHRVSIGQVERLPKRSTGTFQTPKAKGGLLSDMNLHTPGVEGGAAISATPRSLYDAQGFLNTTPGRCRR